MQLGDWQIETASGGRMKADGGTMFGMVPKVLWERHLPPDEYNRITSATNCILARDGRHTVLIDTGYGGKFSAAERQRLAAEPGEPLLASLAGLGVSPGDVDAVVLSHLHFDHAGGGTRDAEGRLVTTFPRARYIVQRGEWEVATSGVPELRGAYPTENFLPLEEAGQLDLIDGNVQILPGLRTLVTGGHTQWHQAILLESGGAGVLYLGDLCPLSAHVRTMWSVSYDAYPLETRRKKPELLGQAADAGWHVVWCHDPEIAVGRLQRDPRRDFVVVDPRRTL